MSWIDLIATDLVISTGDGTVYTPQYMTASVNRHVDYNISEFVFKGLAGSLVKRGTPRGVQYNVEIIFQGGDCVEIAERFMRSAADPGAWTITHPFYGQLYVQPIGLTQDNGRLNQSVISGQVIETLTDKGVAVQNSYPDAIQADAAQVIQNFTDTYAERVPKMQVSDLQRAITHINTIYAKVKAKLHVAQMCVDIYENSYNKAYSILNSTLNATVYNTATIIGSTQQFIDAPAVFEESVIDRVGLFMTQLDILADDVTNIFSYYNRPTSSLKRLYENNAGTAIAGMCTATLTNITTDYNYRPDVLTVVQLVINAWNNYLGNLNALQTDNGGMVDNYVPDPGCLQALQQMVNNTTSALFTISAGAKQQRTYVVPYDTNLVLVAWELYGLVDDDSTIDTLMANNNIGLDEVLVLKKDRKIIYYV